MWRSNYTVDSYPPTCAWGEGLVLFCLLSFPPACPFTPLTNSWTEPLYYAASRLWHLRVDAWPRQLNKRCVKIHSAHFLFRKSNVHNHCISTLNKKELWLWLKSPTALLPAYSLTHFHRDWARFGWKRFFGCYFPIRLESSTYLLWRTMAQLSWADTIVVRCLEWGFPTCLIFLNCWLCL